MTPIFDQLCKEFYREIPRFVSTPIGHGGTRTAVHWFPIVSDPLTWRIHKVIRKEGLWLT